VLLISKNTHQGNVVPKTEQLIHPPTTELILWCNLLAAITNSYRKVISIKAPRGGGFFAFLPRALSSLLLLEFFEWEHLDVSDDLASVAIDAQAVDHQS